MSKSLIYIVDDDPAFSKSLNFLLEKNGYEAIQLFNSGEACLTALDTSKPQFIFLDFSLTGLNGLDTLKTVKKKSPKTKVFIVTFIEDAELQKKCLQQGAALYLNKSELSKGLPASLKKKMKKRLFF